MSLTLYLRRIPFAPAIAARVLRSAGTAYCALLGESSYHVFVSRGGVKYDLDIHEDVQMRIFFGNYDTDELHILREYLRPGDTAIDVGAQVGYFTLNFSLAVGQAGRVVAFEPDPRHVERLRANIGLNPFARNVTVVPEAVSNVAGKATLFRSSAEHSGGNSLYPDVTSVENSIEVPTVTLDEYCTEHGLDRVRVLKIDVEGHEPVVLQGCSRMLSERRIDLVLMEYVASRLRALGFAPDEFDEALRRNGYVRIFPKDIPHADNVLNLIYRSPDLGAGPTAA